MRFDIERLRYYLRILAIVALIGISLWQKGRDSSSNSTQEPVLRPPATSRAHPPREEKLNTNTQTELTIRFERLPREAKETLRILESNGPFPYERDGSNFGNYEGRLPNKKNGYYKEYTVRTPGTKDRGARRIVVGKAGERYYTEDHYQSFKQVLK